MPNGNTHLIVGAIGGAVASVVVQHRLHENKKLDPGHVLLSTGAALAVSRLPDILEPATSPNHRAFFHSLVFSAVLIFLGREVWQEMKEKREQRKRLGVKEISGWEIFGGLALIAIGAILLHLLMDWTTKKGLPAV